MNRRDTLKLLAGACAGLPVTTQLAAGAPAPSTKPWAVVYSRLGAYCVRLQDIEHQNREAVLECLKRLEDRIGDMLEDLPTDDRWIVEAHIPDDSCQAVIDIGMAKEVTSKGQVPVKHLSALGRTVQIHDSAEHFSRVCDIRIYPKSLEPSPAARDFFECCNDGA